MKIKHALITFVIGSCLIILGSIAKLMHWFGTDEMFIIGIILQITSVIIFVIKLLKHPRIKHLVNRY